MDVIRMPLNEYPKYTGQPKFGISDTYWQIYWFYKDRPQTCNYKIVYDSGIDLNRVIPSDHIQLYAAYGIDFRLSSPPITSRRYIAIVPLDDLLTDGVFEQNAAKHLYSPEEEDVGLVFVDYGELDNLDELSYSQKLQLSALINEVYPEAIIANSDLSIFENDIEVDDIDLTNAVKLDDIISVQDVAKGSTASRRETVIREMLAVIDAIKDCKADLIDATKSSIADRFLLGNKAAIEYICLMRYNKTVYFDRYSHAVMYGISNDMSSQNAMYADDYLNYIANLPDVAVYHAAEPLLVFPDREKNRSGVIKFNVFECAIDLQTMELGEEQGKESYTYGDVELLSVAKLFNLDSDNFETAKAGMLKLQELLRKFSMRCKSEMDMRGVLLNISNVIIYNVGGSTYIAYLAYIYANTHFIAYPVRKVSKPFKLDLDLTRAVLRDVRMFWDWKSVMTPYVKAGLVRLQNMFFRPPRYIRGLCMLCAPTDFLTVTPSIGLTFEEIGMYSSVSWSMRKSLMILEYVKQSYIADEVATPFGGPHPAINIRVNINREHWRSHADKVQQFNTY